MLLIGRTVVALALLVLALPARAHDFWIEPSSYRPNVGDDLELALRVGECFAGDEVPRRAGRVMSFVLAGSRATIDVGGDVDVLPAGRTIAHENGPLIAAYRTNRAFIELPAERFESYLVAEGLQHVVQERRRTGMSLVAGREAYSRHAKALIAAGPRGSALVDRPLGLVLEIVAQRDPAELAVGDALPLIVLFEGRPLPGVQVAGTPAADRDEWVGARTDANGAVALRLGHSGPWIVHAVWMRPAPESIDADWESFWASLTFQAGP